MTAPRILAFSGSARKNSFNSRLVEIAAQGARQTGAEVTLINLHDFPMPLFDEDLEKEGRPASVVQLKELFHSHQGLLIAAPEYNSSITPLLKNTIDWISRSAPGEASLSAFRGKIATLMSASPGGFGGLRGLVHVRSILGNIGVLVLPEQIAVPKAHEMFTPEGGLKDEKLQAGVIGLGAGLAQILSKLTN